MIRGVTATSHRMLLYRAKPEANLSEIRNQKIEWLLQATNELTDVGNAIEKLKMVERKGKYI